VRGAGRVEAREERSPYTTDHTLLTRHDMFGRVVLLKVESVLLVVHQRLLRPGLWLIRVQKGELLDGIQRIYDGGWDPTDI
jgi:hypothetical protein